MPENRQVFLDLLPLSCDEQEANEAMRYPLVVMRLSIELFREIPGGSILFLLLLLLSRRESREQSACIAMQHLLPLFFIQHTRLGQQESKRFDQIQ